VDIRKNLSLEFEESGFKSFQMGWLGTHQNPCELNKPFRRKQLATHPFANFAEACCGLMDPKQTDLSGDWGNGEMQQKFDQLRERQKKVGVFGSRSSILGIFGCFQKIGVPPNHPFLL